MENRINNDTQMPIAAPFSASLAMAFFAHCFLTKMTDYSSSAVSYGNYRGGTNVPCQPNVQVEMPYLAKSLMTIAFWYLRENNHIRFAPGAVKGFFSTYTPLVIEVNRSNNAQIPGLEFDLLEIIKHSTPGVTVETVVKQFLHKTSSRPQDKVFERMTQWFVSLGYGRLPDAAPKPFFSFSFRNVANIDFDFVPDCRRIAGCDAAARIIHRNWTKFQAEQPEVFSLLSADVDRAVCQRTASNNDSF